MIWKILCLNCELKRQKRGLISSGTTLSTSDIHLDKRKTLVNLKGQVDNRILWSLLITSLPNLTRYQLTEIDPRILTPFPYLGK